MLRVLLGSRLVPLSGGRLIDPTRDGTSAAPYGLEDRGFESIYKMDTMFLPRRGGVVAEAVDFDADVLVGENVADAGEVVDGVALGLIEQGGESVGDLDGSEACVVGDVEG